jgi:hypothetical protein
MRKIPSGESRHSPKACAFKRRHAKAAFSRFAPLRGWLGTVFPRHSYPDTPEAMLSAVWEV